MRQGKACDEVNVGEVGTGRPVARRVVAAHVAFSVPAASMYCAWGHRKQAQARRARGVRDQSQIAMARCGTWGAARGPDG